MFITRKHLARRTFMKGLGATVALPLLDAMIPAFASSVKQSPRLGFVYVPALLALAFASSLTASAGARLAHRLPVAVLKRIFAVLLYVLATRMAVHYW